MYVYIYISHTYMKHDKSAISNHWETNGIVFKSIRTSKSFEKKMLDLYLIPLKNYNQDLIFLNDKKLLEENVGKYIFNLGIRKDIWNNTQQSKSHKRKYYKFDNIKFKTYESPKHFKS